MNHNIYLNNTKGGIGSFYLINKQNGELDDVLVLNEITFAENVQLFDNWIYFIKPKESGIHQLHKVRLSLK